MGEIAKIDAPLEGFVIEPDTTALGTAAAVIAGHDVIQGLGEEGMCDFHAFVQEVLDTTVGRELDAAKRERRVATDRLELKVASMQASLDASEALIDQMKAERLKLDQRIHNQRKANRANWQIVERRAHSLGSNAARQSLVRHIRWLHRAKALIVALGGEPSVIFQNSPPSTDGQSV